ncbi:MAG TPA: rod shape-determining protein MreC [Coriobacteriia bacterium]
MKRLEIDTRRGAGRPILLVGLVVAALVLTTLWYREGTGGPLHSMRRGIVVVSQPFAAAGSVITAPIRAVSTWLSGLGTSRGDYEALKVQNLELKQRLASLEEAKLENERIRALVDFAKAQDLKTIGAGVIGRPTDSRQRSILIDRGAGSGVKVGDAVIAAGGLVGQVVEVSPWGARVRLITDSDSGVSVLVQRTRANGIVRGSIQGPLQLEFVDKNLAPVRGDVLLTSGLGGVYPKDIVVGEVTDVSSQQVDLFPTITVASRVDIDRIEEVLVIMGVSSTSSQPGGGE